MAAGVRWWLESREAERRSGRKRQSLACLDAGVWCHSRWLLVVVWLRHSAPWTADAAAGRRSSDAGGSWTSSGAAPGPWLRCAIWHRDDEGLREPLRSLPGRTDFRIVSGLLCMPAPVSVVPPHRNKSPFSTASSVGHPELSSVVLEEQDAVAREYSPCSSGAILWRLGLGAQAPHLDWVVLPYRRSVALPSILETIGWRETNEALSKFSFAFRCEATRKAGS